MDLSSPAETSRSQVRRDSHAAAQRIEVLAALVSLVAMTTLTYAHVYKGPYSSGVVERWRYPSLGFLMNEGPNWNDDAEIVAGPDNVLKFGNSMTGSPGPPLFTGSSAGFTWPT